MSEQDKRERAGEWAKGDAEATRFISLDDVAKPSGDTPAPTATAPRRRLAALAAVAACCAVVLVASLGFVYPAEDGSWSLSWLFATTQEVQDSDSTAASDGAHASDEGAEGASSATDCQRRWRYRRPIRPMRRALVIMVKRSPARQPTVQPEQARAHRHQAVRTARALLLRRVVKTLARLLAIPPTPARRARRQIRAPSPFRCR